MLQGCAMAHVMCWWSGWHDLGFGSLSVCLVCGHNIFLVLSPLSQAGWQVGGRSGRLPNQGSHRAVYRRPRGLYLFLISSPWRENQRRSVGPRIHNIHCSSAKALPGIGGDWVQAHYTLVWWATSYYVCWTHSDNNGGGCCSTFCGEVINSLTINSLLSFVLDKMEHECGYVLVILRCSKIRPHPVKICKKYIQVFP